MNLNLFEFFADFSVLTSGFIIPVWALPLLQKENGTAQHVLQEGRDESEVEKKSCRVLELENIH